MPAFNFNPADAVAGFVVLPKATHQLELQEPVSFYKSATQAGKEDNYGVRFATKIVGSEIDALVGKKGPTTTLYMHSEGARNYSKGIQMAALGFTNQEEAAFNQEYAADDWSFNPDDKSCGEAWHKMKGQVVVVDATVKMDEKQNEVQDNMFYRPLKTL